MSQALPNNINQTELVKLQNADMERYTKIWLLTLFIENKILQYQNLLK